MDIKKYTSVREEKYNTQSKERLSKILKKKIETTMIGALSSLEENFKFLWENNTAQKQEMFEIYQKIRSEILDKGNRQIRNMDSELSQYTITWNRYTYNMPVMFKNETGGQ
jgi:hypothetical protein